MMASQLRISGEAQTLAARKSRRRRKPTKYALDALDPLKDIFSDTEDSDAPARKRQIDLDDEFDDDTPTEDAVFEELGSGDFGGQSPTEQSDDGEDDDVMSVEDDAGGHTGSSLRDYTRKLANMRAGDGDQRTVIPYTGRLDRHLEIPSTELRGGGRDDFLRAHYGPAESDIEKITWVLMRWATDPVLPQRMVDDQGTLGVAYTPWFSDAQRARDAKEAWRWYDNIEVPRKLQSIAVMEETQAEAFIPRADDDLAFLLGPHSEQKLYTLGFGDHMNFAQAWQKEETGMQQKGIREGWMINTGGRIQTLGWAPNRSGKSQVLALSVYSGALEGQQETSAHVASPGPSSIQIWKVVSKTELGNVGRLDMETAPKLIQVICTDWGELKQLKWCPVTRNLTDHRFGLIATVWGDGKARVFDIGTDETTDTAYVKYENALFTGDLPWTMCSCVDWISSTTIAVGHSNGMLAIWDIPSSRLLLAHAIQKTYITAIAVAYPSHPHMLASTTIDGSVHLTSLTTLHSTSAQRMAYGNNVLSWNDYLQMFVTYDNLYNIRMHPLRRFVSNTTMLQTRSTILEVACSPCHPFILACGAGGEVEATNPIRRFFDQRHHRLPAYQQTWFIHEWRPKATQIETDTSEVSESAKYNSLARIQEGLSINITHDTKQKPLDNTNPNSKTKSKGKPKKVAGLMAAEGKGRNNYGIVSQTVYELQTAVTTVGWNPNLECGGWAAAGIGTGLLRIEDLCL